MINGHPPFRPSTTLQSMLTDSNRLTLATLIQAKRELPGALLPLLHDVQEAFGCIPFDAVPLIAEALNLSRAEVHGVVTFYHEFRDQPVGRTHVRVCRAEACQSMGSESLWEHACQHMDTVKAHAAAGEFSLEPVYCLGLCSSSPAIMINDAVHARVSHARFDQLLGTLPVSSEKGAP